MIPPARSRWTFRCCAATAVVASASIIWSEARADLNRAASLFPSQDALAGAALALFGATVASVGLRWTLRARHAGERGMVALFVDAAATCLGLAALALFAWAALR